MSSSSSANKRTLIGRPSSSLRSQNKRLSPKEGDTFIKLIPIPATGAEKIFSSIIKWRNLFSVVDSNSNYLYKLNRINIEVSI